MEAAHEVALMAEEALLAASRHPPLPPTCQLLLATTTPQPWTCLPALPQYQPPVVEEAGAGRLRWTPRLHSLFTAAVQQLGGAFTATPKRILEWMGVPGLTLFHIKSHLQKYRKAVGGAHKAQRGRKRQHRAQPALSKGASTATPAVSTGLAAPAPFSTACCSSDGARGGGSSSASLGASMGCQVSCDNDDIWLALLGQDDSEGAGSADEGGGSSGGSDSEAELLPGDGILGGGSLSLLMQWSMDEILLGLAVPPVPGATGPGSAGLAAPEACVGADTLVAGGSAAGNAAALPAAGAAAAVAPLPAAVQAAAAAPAARLTDQGVQPVAPQEGVLREALLLQLDMQKRLSATIQAQLEEHSAYIQRLLGAKGTPSTQQQQQQRFSGQGQLPELQPSCLPPQQQQSGQLSLRSLPTSPAAPCSLSHASLASSLTLESGTMSERPMPAAPMPGPMVSMQTAL